MTLHTVLCVDDEPGVRMALKMELQAEFRVLQASDGKEALEVLSREPVDIVISDLEMPGMTGLELVAKVRARFPEVIRVILTGRVDLISALTAINKGEVFRYLTKPWLEDELKEVLAGAVAQRGKVRRADSERLLTELEHRYPGIRTLPTGTHSIDEERVRQLERALPADLFALVRG